MKVYFFRFKGLWMGGRIHIIAETEEDALKFAKEKINNDIKLKEEQKKEIYLLKTVEIEKKIIYYDNGDY